MRTNPVFWDRVEGVLHYAVLAAWAAGAFLVLFVILWCIFSLPL